MKSSRTGPRSGTVEIDRLAPFVLVAVSEIGAENAEIISVRAEMIVNDIEDNGDAESMGAVDKLAKIIGLSIKPGRREQIDPIISPTEPARKIRDRHHLKTVMPSSAKAGNCRVAASQPPSGVKVPICIS